MKNSPTELRCWVEINLGNLEYNLSGIRAALPAQIKYIAVVKADAYGLGIAPVVSRLMHCGADLFAVANLKEAAEIREIGSGWPLLILSAILPQEERHIPELNVIPSISCREEVIRFSRVGREHHQVIPVHMKLDTGMGRLGVWHEDAFHLYEQIMREPTLRLEGVFTHFSSADIDSVYTEIQRNCFLNFLNKVPDLASRNWLIHADNSAGLDTFPKDSPFNGVRVGLLQFGIAPYSDSLLSTVRVRPVFSFYTRVGLVKTLPKGAAISYGRTHILGKRTRIAVLTGGYADGIPTSMSNKGSVIIHGQRCPILGRVTMDQVIVDVSELPDVKPGDTVTLIGQQGAQGIPITEFASWANQIPWEILVSITKRVERVYRLDTAL
jgi:alanine racemase